MCSANNSKREVRIKIEEESIYSTPGKSQSAPLETESSEEFHLARDHFSTSCVEVPISDSVQSLLNNAFVKESDINDDEPKIIKDYGCCCNKAKSKVTNKPKDEVTTSPVVKHSTLVKPCPSGKPCAPTKPRQEVKLKTTSDSATQTQIKESECRQNIDINISEIKPVISSGVINIPIHLKVSIKQPTNLASGKQERVEISPEKSTAVLEQKSLPKKYVFQMCTNMDYVEPYMDEILDDENIVSCKEILSSPFFKPKTNLLFNAHCSDDYVEPYVKVGYSESQEIVKARKKRKAPKSAPSSTYSDDDEYYADESDSVIDLTKDDGSQIHWEEVILQLKDTIKIAQVKHEETEVEETNDLPSTAESLPSGEVVEKAPKKKKKGGCFGCCSSSDDDDDDTLPIVSQKPVAKLSLVYGKHCQDPEPYTLALLREYPHEKMSDSPCSSKPEIPWTTLILPQQFKIRTMNNIEVKKIKEDQFKSSSAPCICSPMKSDSKIPSEQNDIKQKIIKPSEFIVPSRKGSVAFTDNKLVTLYPPPAARIPSKLPVIVCKSNSLKQQLSKEKEPVGIIKTKLSGKSMSDHGTMRTKVTLSGKDLNDLLKSEGKLHSSVKINDIPSQKLSSKKIDPATSQIKKPSSRSVSSLEPNICSLNSCPVIAQQSGTGIQANSKGMLQPQTKIKIEKLSLTSLRVKQDPVLTAFIACEAELKPVKQALNQVQAKLRNMNMPELDSIFSKGTQLANEFLNKRNKDVYRSNIVSGFGITGVNRTNMNVMKEGIRMCYPPSVRTYPPSYASPSPSTTYMQYKSRPYSNVEAYQYAAPSYRPQYSPSPSTVSSCAPSMHNFSPRPNYDMNCQYSLETSFSNSSFHRSNSDVRHISYNLDQNDNWRNGSGRCCCRSSNYSSDRRVHSKRSDDELSISSTSLPSDESICEINRNSKRIKKRAVQKCKNNNSEILPQQSLCPFLQAMKSILVLDKKKITKKKGVNGISYDTRMSTKNIKNMRVHMRVRTSKKGKTK